MTWCGFKIKENWNVLVNQFHANFCSKTLGWMKIRSVFWDVEWCLNASWGLKGLICFISRENHCYWELNVLYIIDGDPRVVVSTAAFHARFRVSFPGLGGLKETKMFLPRPLVKLSIVGSLRDREVACSTSDRQDFNFESCVWRAVSSHSSRNSQEVPLAQFSLCVHKSGPIHFISLYI